MKNKNRYEKPYIEFIRKNKLFSKYIEWLDEEDD